MEDMLRLKLPGLIAVISLFHQAHFCLENALPQEAWVTDHELEEFRIRDRSDERVVFLMARDFVFSCNGTVQRWIIRWFYRDASPNCATITFTFYVLRQSVDCGITTIEGHNMFPFTVATSRDQTIVSVFEVNSQERISVQKGDFVAVTMELTSSDCPDIRARVTGVRGIPNRVFHGLFPDLTAALGPGLISPCSSYIQDELLVPYITVVFDAATEMPEPQPQSTSTENQQPTTTLVNLATPSDIATSVTEHTTTAATEMPEPQPQSTSTENQQPTTTLVNLATPSDIATSVTEHITTAVINPVARTTLPLKPDARTTVAIEPDATGPSPTEPATLQSASHEAKLNATTKVTTTLPHYVAATTATILRESFSRIDSSCCVNSTGVSTSTMEGKFNDILLLVGVGGGSCVLFLLIAILTATACCLLRRRKHRETNGDSVKMEGKSCDNEGARTEPLYDDPHHFNHHFHKGSMKVNRAYGSVFHLAAEGSSGASDVQKTPQHEISMLHNGAYGSAISQPVEEMRDYQIPASFKKGHGFEMSINGAYGSRT